MYGKQGSLVSEGGFGLSSGFGGVVGGFGEGGLPPEDDCGLVSGGFVVGGFSSGFFSSGLGVEGEGVGGLEDG